MWMRLSYAKRKLACKGGRYLPFYYVTQRWYETAV